MHLLMDRKIKTEEWIIIFIILSSLGFPGNFEKVLGNWLGTLVDYTGFALQLVLVMTSAKGNFGKIKKSQLPVFLFLTIVLVVSLSVTHFFLLETITCFRLVVLVLFCFYLVDQYSVEIIVRLLCSAQIIFLFFSGCLLVIWPALALQNTSLVVSAFRGLYSTKNSCASELSCCIILMVAAIKTEIIKIKGKNRAVVVLLLIQTVALLECQATGAILTTLVSVIYCLFFSEFRINPAWLFLGVSFVFLFAAVEVLPRIAGILLLIGKDATLTGRTLLWNRIIAVMTTNNTWTGFGYGMFWRDPSAYGLLHQGFSVYSFLGNMTSGAHNAILELWLGVGLIGVAALAYMLFATMKKYKAWKDSVYMFIFAYLLFFTFHGLTERAFDNSSYSTLLLFAVIAMAVHPKAAKERANNEQ